MKIINGERRGRPGRWLLDFYDQDGKRRWETYETQREAKTALSKRLEELRKGTYRAPTEIPTVAELAAGWLVSKADRRPSTRYCWENHVGVHIVPAIGDVRIDLVTPRLVEERVRNVLRERLEPQTVNKILGTLTAIYDYGMRHGTIDRNPAKLAERLRVGTAEIVPGVEAKSETAGREIDPDEVPSPEEVKRLLVASEPGVFRTFFSNGRADGGALRGATRSHVRGRGLRRLGDSHSPRGDLGADERGPREGHQGASVLRAEEQDLEAFRGDASGSCDGATALEERLSPVSGRAHLPEARRHGDAPQGTRRAGSFAGARAGAATSLRCPRAPALLRVGIDPPGLSADRGCRASRALLADGHDDGLRAVVSRGDERRGRGARQDALRGVMVGVAGRSTAGTVPQLP
jgi:hypothetical protein